MYDLKLIYLFIAGLAIYKSVQAASVPEPVAIYPLNAKYTTREIKNRQPQGKPVGVSLAPGRDGEPGGSYQFAGTAKSYIEFPNNGGLDVKHSITMLCWVYPESKDGPLFQYFTTDPKLWGTHMWFILEGQLHLRVVRRENYEYTHALVSTSLALNQWHYVGSSYDYNTGVARLWVDGQKVVELDLGAGIDLATQDDVRMGATLNDHRFFKGRITAMQIYDIALTPEQINEVKEAGRGVDICQTEKPCKNGAECESSGDSYTCKCTEGFKVPTCESDINECKALKPCKNGARCKNTIGGYECQCKPGFTGPNCETDIDECSVKNVVCYNGGTCVDHANSYRCECRSGYLGNHCEWEKQGCFKEIKSKKEKAMAKNYATFRKYKKNITGAVEACMKAAEKQKLTIFGIRQRVRCVTTKGDADFARHGSSKACKGSGEYEVGLKGANFVYVLKKEE